MNNLFKISDKDYIPFHSFSMKWRFTDPKYNVLPKKELMQVRPLTKKTSFHLHQYTIAFFKNFQLDIDQFESIEKLETPYENFLIMEWLWSKIPEENKKIIISWDNENSVVTNRKIFCKYWDDFCYPGSDDVIIMSFDGKWLMHYFHGDQFQMGKLKKE